MLGFIKRSTRTIKNFKVRRTLYITLVRSQMGYATQVWSPQTIGLIARLERVQRRASKYILDLPFLCESSYTQRLIDLVFLPLSYWHEYLDMLFFYQLNCGIMCLSDTVLPKPLLFRTPFTSKLENVKPRPTMNRLIYDKNNKNMEHITRINNRKSNSLITFKSLLIKYYYTALDRN
jgi:hypothetical protein